jgi:integrase
LAKDLKVAASTQNQAYSALSYYYQKVLLIDLGNASQKLKAKPKSNIPVSYSEKELQKIFKFMSGIELLMVKLMYGSGLRSGECLQLRIRDLDFKNKLIRVRNNYGVVKRDTVLPACLIRLLEEQVREAKKVYSSDRARDFPGVFLPESYEALGDEESDWEWFWLFPCSSIKAASVISDLKRDHHHAYHLKNEFKKALELSEVNSRSNLDSLRHSFAMGLLEGGYDIRTVQVLLGHQSVKMTMRYLKARQVRSLSVLSPLDQMEDD